MNSGCYGEDISQILHSIKAINKKGNEIEIKAKDINFFYRGTDLAEDLIITRVQLIGKISSKENIEKKQNNLILRKKNSQPSQIKTCGSTFKNTETKKAWELIKHSGCENLRVGNAKISEKHCNFFVNEGKASSKDLENLINKVKSAVYEKTKINIELEIKIIGKPN